MDAAQKKRIIKRYIKERSESPDRVNLEDDALAPYAALDGLLDHITLNNNGLFDFATLELDELQWKNFTDVLNYSTVFTAGSPPTLTGIKERSAEFGLNYLRNARDISALPKSNYYARPTSIPAEADLELNEEIQNARAKLYALLQTVPGETAFNPADIAQVNLRIKTVTDLIKPLADANPQKALLLNRLNILMDLNKVNQLERIAIPLDNGATSVYCTLAEAAGGVTEKISLVSVDSVKTQLGRLNEQEDLTVERYNQNRAQFKLSTEAIIKLPKHGDIKEVQREAMALNISRIMGLDTGSSTTISHKGHPAMFVPFDNIQLLSEFSSGKTFTAGLGIGGQTYTHYSTIKPVGEGMQGDRFVDDFGNSLALFYLCSDTDAVGGYCQNKALRNGRSLFVFDQVIMDSDKFILDSRLSLQPNQFIVKHTRHGQGRNRTLIEDSSMVSKYASILHLKESGAKIIQYANHVAWQHHNRAETLRDQLGGVLDRATRDRLLDELKDVEILERDAITIKTKIEGRIKKIDEVLPKTTGVVSSDEVRQALILEKLIHNPVLFSDDGRPYKNPWTNRQTNTVQSIRDMGNGSVQINFKSKVPPDMMQFIKRHGGGDSMALVSAKVLTISKADLNTLSEGMLHPEHQTILSPDRDYLAREDLAAIKSAYGVGHRTRIINTITTYKSIMNDAERRPADKIAALTKTEADLKEFIRTAKDKGLGMHVLKKFYFDAQQQLQKLMNPDLMPANLNEAFSAALKLDRVSEFNAVVREAIAQNKLADAQFTGFLTACIQKAALATNHPEGVRESQNLSLDAQRVINHFQLPAVPILMQLAVHEVADDGVAHLDPLAALEDDLRMEHGLLTAEPVTHDAERPTDPIPDESFTEDHSMRVK
ncbi:hypothetical protein [Legionella worsleiensis]|uniref:Coiled-coil protein n=1 Tax=Legionella worsleiensis TaxID=45076 RepID=A0A0W1A647_9GAMM|nr:hypothetical protein [Legionella worsleiensis]KTD76821.1 coiled-coil protein [Legionella worsleiensis]STY30684.1 coiled-coil protein [Legionella worsleiensis]